jgi:opacity protein-like surface antigen
MRRSLVLALVLIAAADMARAQSAAPDVNRGYIEGVAQSAFGNVTSQSYGGEVGATVATNLQVFAEAGQIRNVATPEIGASAQRIASALTELQPAAVTYSVKQPVTFAVGGVRYVIPSTSLLKPYVLGGFGAARVTNDVKFLIGGADATSTLSQFVTVGSDLSGEFTKPMLTLGGGVMWPAWQQLVFDFQYRFGRIFAEDQGITANRAGVGIGVRF